MTEIENLWQLVDEADEHARRASKRLSLVADLLADADLAATQAAERIEQIQELANRLLGRD